MFKQKLNLGQKLTKTVKKPRNSKRDNSKNQLGQNSKTQIVTKLKKKNLTSTKLKLKWLQN